MRRAAILIAVLLVGGAPLMGRFFAGRASGVSTAYALFNGQNGDGVYYLGAATRTNGEWEEYALNPVISPGASGTWDDAGVHGPSLVWNGSEYRAYYGGYDGATFRIGFATAPAVNGPWTKQGMVLDVGSSGDFDDGRVWFPTVIYEPTDTGKEWKMWYGGNDGSVARIGYAYSSDGITWTKVGMVLDLGTGGQWDDVEVMPGAIIKVAGTYYLHYLGRSSATPSYFWQGGLVTFTDPEGTYTRDAGNPLVKARFNDSSTSQVPTADVTAGATTVSLTTPGAFNVGEPVVIADGDSTAENFYVTAVGGSSVTLDHAVTGNFTGGGKQFRSFAFQCVYPRSILSRPSGGYELIGTVFQPVEDLTQPASKLWEGSFEWRGAALDDDFDYYYVAGRGLLFPLSIGAAWHTRSAENPSVIAAP